MEFLAEISAFTVKDQFESNDGEKNGGFLELRLFSIRICRLFKLSSFWTGLLPADII